MHLASLFFVLVVRYAWPQGGTCRLALNTAGECTRGGYPEYVVNATTVKHIQAAINFARNKNIRLVIKNTGHDFAGRSMGAGSLSIWVHNIKDFSFIPEYTAGLYRGMAVQVGAGLESWEHRKHMAKHNISVVTPGGGTVGAVGGWISVAGHGWLTSKFGLGADQVLAVNVVTADGRFRTIDMKSENLEEELWWALRGGGPSTFPWATPQRTVSLLTSPSRHLWRYHLRHPPGLRTRKYRSRSHHLLYLLLRPSLFPRGLLELHLELLPLLRQFRHLQRRLLPRLHLPPWQRFLQLFHPDHPSQPFPSPNARSLEPAVQTARPALSGGKFDPNLSIRGQHPHRPALPLARDTVPISHFSGLSFPQRLWREHQHRLERGVRLDTARGRGSGVHVFGGKLRDSRAGPSAARRGEPLVGSGGGQCGVALAGGLAGEFG
ncbi:hypothetical protein VTJ83DRAFT_6106 [Remersonia thermophila]|uniref:FAD-binding PCMH-type domain-containing protein n=1 Tax=Remersonia thermophila TaxID=72144 RepID=A0ABR4D8R0_9PEZI